VLVLRRLYVFWGNLGSDGLECWTTGTRSANRSALEGLHTSILVSAHGWPIIVVLIAAVRGNWSTIRLGVVAPLGRSRSRSSLVVGVLAPTVSGRESKVSLGISRWYGRAVIFGSSGSFDISPMCSAGVIDRTMEGGRGGRMKGDLPVLQRRGQRSCSMEAKEGRDDDGDSDGKA
jgi:hypothetical protein